MIASDSTADIAGAWLLKDTVGWEPARNPLNRYSSAEHGSLANLVGPGFGFAREMHPLAPAKEFGLVVNARDGSALKEWVKGTRYYMETLARTRFAMKTGTLKVILWHQGESDNGDTAYVTRLNGFIDSLRKDLGRPELPFIAGQLGSWGTKYAGLNQRIPALAVRVKLTAVVRSDSLAHKGDSTHFDRAGQIKLGEGGLDVDLQGNRDREARNGPVRRSHTGRGDRRDSRDALGRAPGRGAGPGSGSLMKGRGQGAGTTLRFPG